MSASREQEWKTKLANLERAYQVGFVNVGEDTEPGSARRILGSTPPEEREALVATAAETLDIAAEDIGVTAESGECGQVLSGTFQSADGAAGGAHSDCDILLGETCALASIKQLAQQAEFHGCFLPGLPIARDLRNAGAFGLAIANDRFIRDVSHGV